MGMFEATNPALAHLLMPRGSNVCPDYSFKGRECAGICGEPCPLNKKQFYSPNHLAKKDLEDIGDSFLVNGDGFFAANSFRCCTLAPRYEPLLEPKYNRT